MKDEKKYQRPHYGFPLFAILLITVGIVLLLQTIGLVSWNLWGHLWRFWPILIIIIGVNIVFGRWLPWLAAIINICLIALAFTLAAWQVGPGTESTEVITQPFSRQLENFESASVNINFGAGELKLGSLLQDSDMLVSGDTSGPEGAKMSLNLSRSDSKARLTLSYPHEGWQMFKQTFRWNINLSQRIPLELDMETGASSCNLNLNDLKVSNLNIKAGAASLDVKLPKASGYTDVSVSAGAANIDITIPEGVAAKIHHTGFSSLNIDEGRFPKSGENNTSPNYDSATNRVKIEISSGAASISIK